MAGLACWHSRGRPGKATKGRKKTQELPSKNFFKIFLQRVLTGQPEGDNHPAKNRQLLCQTNGKQERGWSERMLGRNSTSGLPLRLGAEE